MPINGNQEEQIDQRVLITGATGFIGSFLCKQLQKTKRNYRSAVRDHLANTVHSIVIEDIDSQTDWGQALHGIDVVIHLAARTHIMNDTALDPFAEFRRVNIEGTLNLARQAAAAGVKRFIFISSVKVNGESTTNFKPFTEVQATAPQDLYGMSKKEAEEGLYAIADETGMTVVIIRSPLVYGPGVKANFYNLLKLAYTSFPLPFGAVHNKRSMIYLENLVEFIMKCIDYPAAANQTFLISDGKDLSLSELLKYIREALGQPARLFSVPLFLFELAGLLTRKQAVMNRLVGDLQVDSSKARSLLDWSPPYTVEEGIRATVEAYKNGSD